MAEFTLQLLHVTDQEGAAPALVDASNLSAVLNALEDDYDNTLILSSGDLWLPGLFYSASAEVYGFTNEDGEFEGVPGIADILINSALGFDAVAFGNHEFDQGTGAIAALLRANPDITGPGLGEGGYPGAAFPYLSANLDFSADPNLADLVVADGQDVATIPSKIAKSAITEVGGEKIGLVGATTPTLPTVSSPGDDVGVSPADPEDYEELAAIIQAEVDSLLAANPDLNKVILLAHMQVLDIEVNELAPRLTGVDIIIGGGSDTILANEGDRLRDGDAAAGPYPIIQTGADGNPIAIVTTDGQYLYVGQLVVDFDADGILIADSIDPAISGPYATDEAGVAALGAEGLTDPVVTEVIAALNGVIEEKERNVFGVTEVFLNGRRAGGGLDGVRSQETNLGNLTADANLWYARQFDEAVDISIKNGGGIRESIGAVVTPPGGTEPVRVPPEGNPNFGKPEGGITQTDVESVLAFNNGLSVVTTTVEELKAILEHTVSGATAETIDSDFGSFGQVAGIQFSFDIAFEPGDRVRSLTLVDDDGNDTEVLVQNGEIQGDPTRTYRLVTLNFLADGGSGYPIPQTERVDLVDFASLDFDGGLATFAETGSEQDAFAEYLATFFPADDDPATPVFMMEDTVVAEDDRIQNLFFREDTVIDGVVPPIEEPEVPDFSDGFEGPFSEIGRLILEAGAEINAFDPVSASLYVVSGETVVQVVDLSDPVNPTLAEVIDLSEFGGGVNSVAVKDGIVALAVEADPSTDNGVVVFLTTAGEVLGTVAVGAVPDMVTFTPDGRKVLVANEGEPNDDYSIDPEGSISVIDISGGVENATAAIADFTAFNDQLAELQAAGVKLFGLDATVAEDLEPEYIAVSPDGSTAWVTLQENNAVAVVDIETAIVTDILPLGAKDFSTDAQLDASNRDDGINIRNWPVFGLYQPDAIASYAVDGMTYYVTANEGDARLRPDGDLEDADGTVILEEGVVFNEENRIGDEEIVLDPDAFPNAAELKLDENLGRLNITNKLGDIDGDGDFDQLFSYGARSFSIWDESGTLVFDSGDDIANITAQLTPELFNANDGDPEEFDNRSDDKGAEPEAITIGQIDDTIYAFVGLERAGGGVLIYDITNPVEAEFVQYVRSDEDIAPEGLTFIADVDSPNGTNLLIVANEESSTLTVYSDGDGGSGGGSGGNLTSIFDIQGAGHTSPLLGETVTTTGLVTAVDTNGFYLQDAEGDGDIATSDALFVFTGGEPGVAVGDALNVTGTVSEFTPGGAATGNLSATQISGNPEIAVLSSGNDLPAAVILGEGGRIPPNASIDDDAFASFDPETDGIDFFESLEAMRVTAQDAVAISGTNRFGEIFTVVDGGDRATGLSDGQGPAQEGHRGTLNIGPDDFNPEKVQIDEDSGIFDFDFPSVDVGAFLGDVTGVVGYTFGNFEIYPTEAFGVPTWDVEYSGWWDAEGGGTLSGTLFAEAAAADDGLLTADELLAWEWNWSGNDAVAAFSIASSDAGADLQQFGPTGFYVDGTLNLPALADDLEQGIFVGGESGEFVLDLEFLTIEDNSVSFPTAAGAVTVGTLPVAPEGIEFTAVTWDLEYSGWWEAAGGGTLSGTLFTDGAAADDGVLTADELLAWEWDWSGNDAVAAFSINSGESGADLQQFGPTGFYVDGTPNQPDLTDDLEQGVFIGGESGEFVLDLEFLTIEDNSASFPTADGTVTEGDIAAAMGAIAFTDVVWDIEYSGWWDAEGGGTLSGTLFTDGAAADDGILTPEELLAWQWDWSGNDEVSPFFISSSDAGAELQPFGASGFYVDGTANLPALTDGLDQGLFIGGESGEYVIDLEFLTIEDNSESFPTAVGEVTVGEATPLPGAVTVTDAALAVAPSSLQPEVSSLMGGEDKLTVASYNLLNLDPTVESIERVDANDEGDIDDDIGNGRFEAIAQQIVNNLNAPDIIGLQEVQDNDGAEITDVSEADETLRTLIDAIAAAGGPTYALIDTPDVLPTFIDEDGSVVRPSGGQPGGNIRNAFLYNRDRVDLVEGSVQPIGSQAVGATFEGARRPLSATFEFNSEEITIVNNHFSSKGGSAPILGVEQPFEQRQEDPDVNGSLNERRVQAQAVNNFVDDLFAADADANVMVLGDLNEFEFVSPLDILAGTVESTDDGFGIESTGEAAILNNLVNTIDPDERYSFIFQGNAQVLDHILVSDSLFDGAEFDFVNVNVEFAETDSRASDHEPILARFDLGHDRAMPVDELLDLTGFDGDVAANVTLSREAAFDNILQFYETDAVGAVGGLLPGEAGYEDGVRENLIAGLELFVANLTTTETDVLLGGGTFYAPALLVNSNPQNLVTIDDAAMGMGMIQRDDNVWRFEDLTDFDYDDFVLTLNSAEALSSAS